MIYIVRHGQTDWNKQKRFAGRIDVPLNDEGVRQAKETAEKLKNISFDFVFSSPMTRTLQTAKIITDKKIIKDDRIIERSNGQLEGKFKYEVPDDIDFNDENENRFDIENIKDFRKRIFDFWQDITTKYKHKNILVVTHAGVTIYTRCFFEGDPKDLNFDKLKLDNCQILTYEN